MSTLNLTLMTDLYEMTMMQGYFKTQNHEVVVFDAFYRNNPCDGGYAICAGLDQVIEYIKDLHFDENDLAYLKSLNIFDDDFLEYLANFHFSGDIYAIPEGTVIFPREPIIKVVAPIMEAQLVETAILNIINHQSLIATRMTTEQMLPIVDKMDKVGYHSVECWGGATFDASLRFLKEDPWERLRKFRDGFKNTKLQMLFRGQNILGYRPYADDVVEYFVQKSAANGIDIIRIFDCLNDLRNLKTAVKAANKEKVEAQIALSYTLGDAYTLDYWVDIAKKIEEMGGNSICIKDMGGLLTPYKATELIGAMKEAVDLPIQLHTHYTSGVASMTYMKAVEAGVDVIDTAISPFALGTSQPATEVMVETFKGTPYDTGLDQKLLAEIADYFRPIRDEALDSGLLNPKNLGVNIKTLLYQVPGGMLSNLTSQLKEQGAEDKFYDVLEEVPRVRKDLGEPPLVTPSSQIVGTQAVFNVLMGERYKVATKETKDLLSGKYGQTVKPMNPDVIKKVLGDDPEIITCRPADLLDNELEKLESEMAQYKEQDEDVLTYAKGYLRTISVFFFFLSILYLYRTSLQGLGKGMVPMIGGILELVGRLAVIMLFAKDYGYPAVCLASPVAWIFAGIPNMAAYLLWKRRTKKLL